MSSCSSPPFRQKKTPWKDGFYFSSPKFGYCSWGGASEQLRFVPPSTVGSAHGAEQGFTSTARPHAYNSSWHVQTEVSRELMERFLQQNCTQSSSSHQQRTSERQSRFMQQNKAAKRTWQNRSLHWACLHTSACPCYNAFEFKARQAQKHQFPSAATIQTSHRLLKSPGQNIVFAENSSYEKHLSPAHTSCSKHHIPATKIKALGQLEEPVWLQTAKQKGQR